LPFKCGVRGRMDTLADVERLEMPVEMGLEFSAVVGLNHVDAERQAPEDVIDECDGGALMAGVVDLEHANAGSIVDRRELVEPPARARDAFEKRDVDLEAMPGLRLLVARPAVRVPAVTFGSPAGGSSRADAECDARRHRPPTRCETALDNRQSCRGQSDSAA
jgi:hypothetical protein